MKNSFAGGKILNCKGEKTYKVDGVGVILFKIDKNLAVYEVFPRKITIAGEEHDLLSVVRGQVPDAGIQTLVNNIQKWNEEAERYAS